MSFSDLSYDIILQVLNYCDDYDLQALCQTCKGLMDLLQDRVYREIVLREDPISGHRVQAIASGPRGKLVRSVRYSPSRPEFFNDDDYDGYDDFDDFAEPTVKLSPETQQILKTLHIFPNLNTFRFRLEDWVFQDWPNGSAHFWVDHLFPENEYKEPYRRLLNSSLLALRDSVGAFSKLEIYHLPPLSSRVASYSTFLTGTWRALLRSLKAVDMQLAEIQHVGTDGNMTRGQQGFLHDLDRIMLEHLPNVEHFRLAGRLDACIGGFNEEQTIPWSYIRMPRLKRFELEYAQVDCGVADFIKAHSASLEGLFLRNCYVPAQKDWRDLCQCIQTMDSPNLVEIGISPAVPVTFVSRDGGCLLWDELPENLRHPRFLAVDLHSLNGTLQETSGDGENGVSHSDIVSELEKIKVLVERNKTRKKSDAAR